MEMGAQQTKFGLSDIRMKVEERLYINSKGEQVGRGEKERFCREIKKVSSNMQTLPIQNEGIQTFNHR